MIRPYTSQDAEAARMVIKTVYDEYDFPWEPDGYHADLWRIEEEYIQPGGGFWIAEHEGNVVGVVGLEVFDPIPGPNGQVVTVDGVRRIGGADCELMRLYVLSSARGLKLGRRLSEKVVEEAKLRGRKTLEIWSDKVLTQAHALYQSQGAIIVGERLCSDPTEAPEWGMYLDLK